MADVKDQQSDEEVGGGGNMTFKTTSTAKERTSPAWRDDSDGSTDDNNGFNDRIRTATRNKG
jgi:hypothetical protein